MVTNTYADTYTEKETFEILGTHNEEGVLGEFEMHKAGGRQEEQSEMTDNLLNILLKERLRRIVRRYSLLRDG